MMIIKINHYFQKKEKSLKIFTIKKLDKIEELSNKIDYNDLNYVVVGTGDKYSFDDLDDPPTLLNNIKKGEISMDKAMERQYNFFVNT